MDPMDPLSELLGRMRGASPFEARKLASQIAQLTGESRSSGVSGKHFDFDQVRVGGEIQTKVSDDSSIEDPKDPEVER